MGVLRYRSRTQWREVTLLPRKCPGGFRKEHYAALNGDAKSGAVRSAKNRITGASTINQSPRHEQARKVMPVVVNPSLMRLALGKPSISIAGSCSRDHQLPISAAGRHNLRDVVNLAQRSQQEDDLAAAPPKAVAFLFRDLDVLLSFLAYPVAQRRNLRTTNIIESCLSEVRPRDEAHDMLQQLGYERPVPNGSDAAESPGWRN
jgi:hypothetical protein